MRLSEEPEKTVVSRATLVRLVKLVAPYKGRLALAFALTLVVTAVGMAGPYIMKLAIDEGFAKRNVQLIETLALVFIGAQVVNFFAAWGAGLTIAKLGQHAVYDLRARLFGHLQVLSLSFFDKRRVGSIMSRVTNDIDTLNEFVSSGLVNALTDLLTLVGVIAIMCKMHARLTLYVLVVAPASMLLLMPLQRKLRAAYRATREKIAAVTGFLQEAISGIRVIKSFCREGAYDEKFRTANDEYYQASMRAFRLFAVFLPGVELSGAVATCVIIWYGCVALAKKHAAATLGVAISPAEQAMSVGLILAFLGYLDRLMMPLRSLAQLYNMVQSAAAGAERVFEMQDEKPEVTDPPDAAELPRLEREIRVEGLWFAYEDEEYVLRDVSLTIPAGKVVALVGPTGAGKSTLVKLLSRMYDPQRGRILFDGRDIREVTQASLRRQMGIVLQETFLFSGTVRENIRYGRLEASDEEVERAARAVDADRFIRRLPQGYETRVGERGTVLSMGQRQLIAFARALLADPAILILDEATSSVDVYTESVIQRSLKKLMKGRTCIVIAHRLSTVIDADIIYVLDKGRIVDRGTHRELMARGGLYAMLYGIQFRDVQIDDNVPLRRPLRPPGRLAPEH